MIYVDVIGWIGIDSKMVDTKSGNKMLSFRMASNERIGDKDVTTWIAVMWSGDHSKMVEYLKKGRQVNVHGTLRTSLYQNKDGETRIDHTVFADRVDFVSSGSGNTQTNEAVTATETDFGKLQKKEEVAAASAAVDDLPF